MGWCTHCEMVFGSVTTSTCEFTCVEFIVVLGMGCKEWGWVMFIHNLLIQQICLYMGSIAIYFACVHTLSHCNQPDGLEGSRWQGVTCQWAFIPNVGVVALPGMYIMCSCLFSTVLGIWAWYKD